MSCRESRFMPGTAPHLGLWDAERVPDSRQKLQQPRDHRLYWGFTAWCSLGAADIQCCPSTDSRGVVYGKGVEPHDHLPFTCFL